jgi:hypothetical protein
MQRWRLLRVGVLFAVLPWLAISCGKTKPTEPDLGFEVVSYPGPERFETSPQRETRELLVDGRPTAIEWNMAGNPTYFLASGRGGGGGGDYYVAVRSVWTADRFGNQKAFYLLLQWPDLTASLLDHPIVNDSLDIFDDSGNRLVDCTVNDIAVRPTTWHRANNLEDEVTIQIYSDSLASYPADHWRWGANTTNVVTPSSSFDFEGSARDGDSLGQTTHASAAFAEDYWETGPGSVVDDLGRLCYFGNYTQYPNGVVPVAIASKGSRDTRLNRGKQVAYSVWSYVATPFTACSEFNPIRLDDGSIPDKTWNPGDYVPGYQHIFPTQSQLDVLARGVWEGGKWVLELRRNLISGAEDASGTTVFPWPDDLQFVPGRHYRMRITIRDGQTGLSSSTPLASLYLKPR